MSDDLFSVVIPTLWRSDYVHKLLPRLEECQRVGEIILIDNTGEWKTKIKGVYKKLRIFAQQQNIYVNPAWNLGVYVSKYENICISNDDVSFDTSVFDFIIQHIDKGIIGQDYQNYTSKQQNLRIEKTQTRTSGWGCLLFVKKSNWKPIPSTLKIACGDDYLFNCVYGGAWQLAGLPVETIMCSTSRYTEFSKIQADDISNYNKNFSPLISVFIPTYQRHNFLEEAIQSYLYQTYTGPSELVVLNDCPSVKYTYNHPRIKIINTDYRFESLGYKLKYGLLQCGANYVYRLDDDDLLCPWALESVSEWLKACPNYDIYRSTKHYQFWNNEFKGTHPAVNTGNVYSRKYVMDTEFPNKSMGEDADITFKHTKKIHNSSISTMIYRWGMNTYHISAMKSESNDVIFNKTDEKVVPESGVISLNPKFSSAYYSQLPPLTGGL